MRIGVIGAGAVGGAIAALLARGGHEVEVTARGDHLHAIEAGGIRLTGGWGDFTASVTASERLTRTPALAIVATKALDARAAIAENELVLGAIPVLVVQNGLGGVDAAAAILRDSSVMGGLAMYASSLVAPGEIAITTPGQTYIGSGYGIDLPARYVASVLGAIMPTSIEPNFVGAQWTKLIVNQINALPAITGLSAQEVIGNPGLRALMTRSMQENVRVGQKSGIRFADIQGLSNGRLRAFASAPLWLAQTLPLLLKRRMGPTPNPGSTLQSIRRGALTEIDYLNGAVVEAAAAAGTTAPVNAALVTLVHEVEKSGTFLSPNEVIGRVGELAGS